MTLCIWPMWRLHLGHLTPLAASMVYDDSGRPWCFPDGSRSGHAITALQLGNVTRGDEVAAEKEAVWLWIWSVLYLNPKIEQIHTHISTHTYKINIIHTHTTPQLQGVFLGTSCGIPPNIYFLSWSPILSPVYLPSHHSLFLRSPSYFLIITFNAQGVPINPDAQSKALWDRGRDPKSFSRVSRFASFSPRSAERPISGPGFWGEPDPQQLPHHWCYYSQGGILVYKGARWNQLGPNHSSSNNASLLPSTNCLLWWQRQRRKSMGIGFRQTGVQIPASAVNSWVTLGKSLSLSEPPFLNLCSWNQIEYIFKVLDT